MKYAAPCMLFAATVAGCGGGSPTGPSPTPTQPATFSGSVTDTITGAPVLGFSATISGTRLIVSAPGYISRETRAGASTVDLIPESGFDLDFYRQFARGTMEGQMRSLRLLVGSPRIYLETAGLLASNVAELEQSARAIIPALTGGRLDVQAWETGPARRPEAVGWVVVDIVNDDMECGRSLTGAAAGHVWLNIASKCARSGNAVYPPLLAHELGHSLGFSHVTNADAIMRAPLSAGVRGPSEIERRHAAIAYKRPAGNRDVDIDP